MREGGPIPCPSLPRAPFSSQQTLVQKEIPYESLIIKTGPKKVVWVKSEGGSPCLGLWTLSHSLAAPEALTKEPL